MAVKGSWYERDSRFIAAHHQPALLLDLALARRLDSHRLLRGSGLFHEDILSGQARISPQQFLQLIDNARRLLDADDSSFLFGQRLLPGHYGAASQALQQAADLQQSLELLVRLRALLSPLWRHACYSTNSASTSSGWMPAAAASSDDSCSRRA